MSSTFMGEEEIVEMKKYVSLNQDVELRYTQKLLENQSHIAFKNKVFTRKP